MKHYVVSNLHGQGHKIDIDMASAQTGWGCLLDLGILKPTYISAAGEILG